MKFATAVNQATNHLLKSKAARTAHDYTLEMEKTEHGTLAVTTWGYDYQEIVVPFDRPRMIAQKCRLQMRKRTRDELDEVELRYIFDIMRRESK